MEVANFSAMALLKPKNALPDALFDLSYALDSQKLRDLQPAPADVKKTIELLKKAGIRASKGSSHALNISGPTSALRTIFGVTLKTKDDTSDTPTFAFFDDKDVIVEMPKPVALHPINGILISIFVPPPTQPNNFKPPHHPDAKINPNTKKPDDWAKLEPYHVWPHELREKLGATPLKRRKVKVNQGKAIIKKKMKAYGFGSTVFLNDTGIDRSHPYFKAILDIENSQIIDGNNHVRIRSGKSKIIGAIKEFKEMLKHVQENQQEVSDKLVDGVKKLSENNLCKVLNLKHSDGNYEKDLGHYGQRLITNTNRKITVKYMNTFQTEMNRFKKFADEETSVILETLDQISGLSDLVGHGTAMAASILGVSKHTELISLQNELLPNAKLVRLGFSDIGLPLGNIEYVIELASKAKEDSSPKKARIVSNSWVKLVAIEDLTSDNCISSFLHEAAIFDKAARQRIVVLFGAGNAGRPRKGFISKFALHEQRLIIVGGAWDKNSLPLSSNSNSDVFLSTAAHGYRIQFNRKTIIIPSLCGLVGEQLRPKESPDVYLPIKEHTWRWIGGGTSSATAQVAGVCAAILAQWPNLSPAQVKQALIDGGLDVTQGTSYQGKTPTEINPDGLKRVHIEGAFDKARKLFPST